MDARTVYDVQALLVEHKDGTFEQIKPDTKLSAGGWVYVVCNLCHGLESKDELAECTRCKCKTWLMEYFPHWQDAVANLMERTTLDMDEVVIPEHMANYAIGDPARLKQREQGAVNLRQFAGINAIAASFLMSLPESTKK